ncbi:hypothetical protein HQ520_10490 [bacterium]|nr:hypothetical protein [bacterium]
MLFNTFDQDQAYLLTKFQNPVYDETSGLDNATIRQMLTTLLAEMQGAPHAMIKAEGFACVTRDIRIDVNPHDWFVAFGCWDRYDRMLNVMIDAWHKELKENTLDAPLLQETLIKSACVDMWPDFDHSVPDWDAVFALGFPGLRKRAAQYRQDREAQGPLTRDEQAYYDSIDITYSAIQDLLVRFRQYALDHAAGHPRVLAVADCLKNLICGEPNTTFEALQLIYIYFILGEHVDHMQVRSLGNLDRTLLPYVQRDLGTGAFTEEHIREWIDYFLMQFASIKNYWGHPFYLGGTKADGSSEINTLSYLILEEFEKLDITSPKIQLKIAPNTPVAFLDKALDMVRKHNSSLVFISETGIKRSLMGLGFSEEEARTCDISGCYEYDVRAKEVKTAPIYLNLLKPVELVLNNGMDPVSGLHCGLRTGEIDDLRTFEDFYKAYIRQLDAILEQSIHCADDFEPFLHEINPGPVFSATIENSLKVARDAFSNGSVYNNTVVLHVGLATAADALAAIRQFVYEEREVTLPELKAILAGNWEEHEKLRLHILHNAPRYGNGVASVDALAEAIARFCSQKINLRPNTRGGFYKAGMHSALHYVKLGQGTGATPDGRKSGDEMSKNASPTMGMDRSGVTALIQSAANIDCALFPADYCVDIMLHPITVSGEAGLQAMRSLLQVYMQRTGGSVNFNVFNEEILLDAQNHPERHEGLQVRVCGWNARFVDLTRQEQNAFIDRARHITR